MGVQKMSDLERRNQERREAAGAYFASPQLDASQQATNAPKPPKKVGPFGIDLQLDEFKEPEGFDEMSGSYLRAWPQPKTQITQKLDREVLRS